MVLGKGVVMLLLLNFNIMPICIQTEEKIKRNLNWMPIQKFYIDIRKHNDILIISIIKKRAFFVFFCLKSKLVDHKLYGKPLIILLNN